MVIKINYTSSDVYVSTSVSPVYVVVNYSGTSDTNAVWGQITGTLSNQTDLQNALDAKFDDPTGTTAQYLRGDGSLATFPSLTGFVPYTGATTNVDLGTHRILAQNATIASNGSGDTFTLNHTSGSGIGLNITKGGSGEGLYVNKTSGSGNAATIIGTLNATTLVKSGGTSSQFLKADGSVDSTTYVGGSGASGQVAYWNGTNSQTGSNNLFWDAANARLGIGTNAPSTTLDIRGKTRIQSSGNAELDIIDGSNSLRLAMGSTQGFVGTLSSHPFGFFTGASKRGEFSTNGNFILQNGGTFSDGGQRLQVQGTSYFSDRIGFNSTATTNVTLRNELPISGSTSSFGYYTSSIIQSGVTSSASYFSIAPQTQAASFTLSRLSGFEVNALSIGAGSTITEASAFYGNIASGTGRWNLYMAGTANNYLNGNLGLGVTPSAWTNCKAIDISTIGSVFADGFSQNNQAGFATNAYRAGAAVWFYKGTAAATYYAQDLGTHKWFNAPSGTAGNAITFTQAMTLDASGNLGLGAASPTPYTAGARVLNILSSGVNSEIKLTNSTTGNTAASGLMVSQLGVNSYFWNGSGGFSAFGTDNSERMRLTSGGNLLVGTTTDGGEKFQVNGTARVSGATYLATSSGRVGIGILGPVLKLDVQGNAADTTTVGGVTIEEVTLFRPSNGVGGIRSGFNTTTGHAYIWSSTSGGNLNFGTRSAPDNNVGMTLTFGGNLLVGTTTDAGVKVNISGNVNISSGSFYVYNGDNYIGSASSITGGTSNQLGIRASTDLLFATNGANERMRITSGGNLLVGTTADAGYRVDINGTLRVTNQSLFEVTDAGVGTKTIVATFGRTGASSSGTSREAGIVFRDSAGTTLTSGITGVRENSAGNWLGGLKFYVASNPSLPSSTFANLTEALSINSSGAATFSSSVTAGGGTNNASAILQADSTTRGFLPPRMTNAQRTAISSPAVGLIVYCTDMVEGLYVYKSTGWTFVI
jgi:hypothetical protein